jgi:hypothetical protein
MQPLQPTLSSLAFLMIMVVSLALLFLIIKAFVSLNRLHKQTRLHNHLLTHLLKKNGVDDETIVHYKSQIK